MASWCFASVVSAVELRRLEQGMEYNLAHPGPLAGIATSDADPGRFLEDFCKWDRIPEDRDVLFLSRLPEIKSLCDDELGSAPRLCIDSAI